MSILKPKPNQLDIFLAYHPQINSFKRKAKELHKELLGQVSLMQCQEITAKNQGFNNWHHFLKEKKNQFNLGLSDINFIVRKDKIGPMDGKYINKDFFEEMLMGREATYNHYKYLNTDALRTHTLILGDIHKKYDLFLAKQAIEKNHPISFINGSGDEETIKELIGCARANGREGDIKIFNITQAPLYPEYTVAMSSKITGSSGGFAELIIGSFAQGLDDDEKGKLISFIASIVMAKTYERDVESVELTWLSFMESLRLEHLIELYNKPELPINIRQSIRLNLGALDLIDESTNKVLDITKNAQTQFDLLMAPIAQRIAHMLKCVNMEPNEADMFTSFNSRSTDIIIIQMQKIEHLENSLDLEIHKTISKVVLSQFKIYLASHLGVKLNANSIQGSSAESGLKQKQRKAFLFISEVASPKGFAVAPAQARAIGVSLVFSYNNENPISEQMIPSEAEFDSIAANCSCKIISSTARGKNKALLIQTLKDINSPLYPTDYIEQEVEAQYKTGINEIDGAQEKKAWLIYKNSASIINF